MTEFRTVEIGFDQEGSPVLRSGDGLSEFSVRWLNAVYMRNADTVRRLEDIGRSIHPFRAGFDEEPRGVTLCRRDAHARNSREAGGP